MSRIRPLLLVPLVWIAVLSLHAVEPDGIIFNEVYFNVPAGAKDKFETIELLVIADKSNLNGIQISDRDVWGARTEDQCTLQDLGQGFLNEVPGGTLVVIYNGSGTDDIDSSDHVLRFWAKSSLYCNVAPTGNATQLGDHGDNVHLIQNGKHLDFVKFRASDRPGIGNGDPGNLGWEKGVDGFIDVGPYRENAGFQFLGDKAYLNDYPVAWQVYSESPQVKNSPGEPNGGKNTVWIQSLRKSSSAPTPKSPEPKTSPAPDQK